MKKVIASGAVIVEKGKLLVTMDDKDPFYKIPGGKWNPGESLEQCAIRELKQETGFSCYLIDSLPTLRLDRDPKTHEPADIELNHYFAQLKNLTKDYNSFTYNGHTVAWLDICGIKKEEYPVAPNIKFLLEKGVLK
ncbi:MAG: NUDIX hydrolase [Nanobdellota archaeon]